MTADGMRSEIVDRAINVLIEHQRLDLGSCFCGWGVSTGHWGWSHAEHIAQLLAEAGLLAPGPAGDGSAAI